MTLTLAVPTAGWSLEPVAAYQLPAELWIIHQLRAPEGMAAQVISEVSDTVSLPASALPIKHFVLGKTWNWDSNPEVRFIDSLDSLKPKLDGARQFPLDLAR